ncbi:Takusan domain-containing protein, partial [Pyrenophora tritici-repentis]
MVELRSTEKKSHAGTNLLVVSRGYRHFSFSVTTSPVPVTSKKQFEKEEKELIKKIQLTTEETNELRDRLIYVTEGSMNK